MTPSEIIKKTIEGNGGDPQAVGKRIMYVLKNKLGILMQKNNSVLFLVQLGDGDVECHLFTQDSPVTLFKSLPYFIQKVRSSDIRAIYFPTTNEQLIEALRRLKVDVEPSDRKEYKWKAVV
jgi:hypothetical protein